MLAFQIDSEAVLQFKKEDFENLGLVALGDQVKLRHYCEGTCESDRNLPAYINNRREKLLEMLKSSKRDKKYAGVTTSKSGRPKKTIRKINIGLRILHHKKLDKYGCRIAKQVKAPLGDKNYIVNEYSLDSTYAEMKEEAEAAFFVNGTNFVVGPVIDFACELVNGRNENIESAICGPFTLENYIKEKKIPGAIRLYLLCCPTCMPDEESISGM